MKFLFFSLAALFCFTACNNNMKPKATEMEAKKIPVIIAEPVTYTGDSITMNGFVAYDDEAGYFFVACKKDKFGLGGDVHFLEPVEVGKGGAGGQLVHFAAGVGGSGGGFKFVEGYDGYVFGYLLGDEGTGGFGVGEG